MGQNDYRSRIEEVFQGEIYGESLFAGLADDSIIWITADGRFSAIRKCTVWKGKSIFRTRMWAALPAL
jgi:hypothetical protein